VLIFFKFILHHCCKNICYIVNQNRHPMKRNCKQVHNVTKDSFKRSKEPQHTNDSQKRIPASDELPRHPQTKTVSKKSSNKMSSHINSFGLVRFFQHLKYTFSKTNVYILFKINLKKCFYIFPLTNYILSIRYITLVFGIWFLEFGFWNGGFLPLLY